MPAPITKTEDLLTAARRVRVPMGDVAQQQLSFESAVSVIETRTHNLIRERARELAALVEFASYTIPHNGAHDSTSAIDASTAALLALRDELEVVA